MIDRGRRNPAGQRFVRQQQQRQTIRPARYCQTQPRRTGGCKTRPQRIQRSGKASNQRGAGRPINCTSARRWWRHTEL